MKKFLIGAISLILLVVLIDTAYYQWGFYIDLNRDTPITSFTKVEGKEILVDSENGFAPFEIKGVDMGAGIPGHFATDYAISKETYLRWFKMIQDMGANTIRVYTILSSDFYDAVYEYNHNNPTPLYIIHGVWVNDYVQNSRRDAFDDDFLNTLKKDSRTLVDILHGRKKINLGKSTTSASGSYSKDISPWILGYILGVEWEDITVAYTDNMNTTKNSYHGTYLYTTKDATPFEAMLAEVGDSIIKYESDKYKQQRLVAFSNWPTTDPINYPESINEFFRKCAQVDVEHIKQSDKFISGQFSSYHIYPYYPDYFNQYTEWQTEIPFADKYKLANGTYNTYGVYLELINQHHSMPVVVSEFGTPTSRGRSQTDSNTQRSQGFMSEEQQGKALVSAYQDIMNAGCTGSIIFSWQDEWFKRTWNTMANVDLTQTPYWSDFQTNEQFFGLLSFDPGKKKSVSYTDGDVSEWTKQDIVIENDKLGLSMKYDEKFMYFKIHKENLDFENEKIYIPLDITPNTGSYFAKGEEVKFENPTDFLLILEGKEKSKLLVQERYDVFRAVFNESYEGTNPYFNPPDKDSPVFNNIYMALQLGSMKIDEIQNNDPATVGTIITAEKFETGKLTYGNGNPEHIDYNSVSDFIVQGDFIEIRLPWQLLNFSNPSKMQIHDDYYQNYGIENIGIDHISVGIGSDVSLKERIEMNEVALKGWGKNPTYHERLKQSYYLMQEAWNKE